MPADVKTEQLFFVGELFMFTPWSNQPFSRGRGGGCLTEQGNFTGNPGPVPSGGCAQGFINAGEKFGALTAKKIKRTSFDEAFQHFSISDAGIKPAAKILQRSEVPSPLAFANRGFHCAFADVFDRSKTVTDCPVAGVGDPGCLWLRHAAALSARGYSFRSKLQS